MPDVRPTFTETLANRVVGVLARLGIGPGYLYMLEVPGRKSGRIHSTPVDLMDTKGGLYLVAPRGETQWVRNARVAGEITLRRGRSAVRFSVTELADEEKGPLLKEYLRRYRSAVQQFFPIVPDEPTEAFSELGPRYPVFALQAEADS